MEALEDVQITAAEDILLKECAFIGVAKMIT